MAEHKSILRTIYDAMIESRARQAQREVANYRVAIRTGNIEADKF